jgi:hypothetical protein
VATRFERSRTMPIYWYNKAADLRAAAGLVWDGMEDERGADVAVSLGLGRGFSFRAACRPVYRMLCGLALELLLKAALVAQGKQPGRHHRLTDLWDDVGLARTDEQTGLLQILAKSISWAGRYPVPKTEADYDRLDELSAKHLWDPVATLGGGLVIRRSNSKLDWPSFNALWSDVHGAPALRGIFDRPGMERRES